MGRHLRRPIELPPLLKLRGNCTALAKWQSKDHRDSDMPTMFTHLDRRILDTEVFLPMRLMVRARERKHLPARIEQGIWDVGPSMGKSAAAALTELGGRWHYGVREAIDKSAAWTSEPTTLTMFRQTVTLMFREEADIDLFRGLVAVHG